MRDQLKNLLGNLLITLKPQYAHKLATEGINATVNHGMSTIDRLMRYSILNDAETNLDFEKLAEYHRVFWKKRGHDHFSKYEDTLNGFFLPHCSYVFEELDKLLRTCPVHFDTMIEIGTGHGDVINYFSSEFEGINNFIGIDLSPVQIAVIQKKYEENSRLTFVAGDALEWIKNNGKDKTVFFTSGGVLEYFTEKRLQKFFEDLNNLGPIIYIAIEPVGSQIDFRKNPSSQPYGTEKSFSHNYTRLFKNAGFDIWHDSIIPYKPEFCNFWAVGAQNFK